MTFSASISGTASSSGTGGRTRVDLDPASGPEDILCDLRETASASFSCGFASLNDRLIVSRWKPGSAAAGTISVSGGPVGGKIMCAGAQVGSNLDENGNGSSGFTFSGQGQELTVEHA